MELIVKKLSQERIEELGNVIFIFIKIFRLFII